MLWSPCSGVEGLGRDLSGGGRHEAIPHYDSQVIVGGFALDSKDGIVDQRGDVGAGGLILQIRPTRSGGTQKTALGRVFVAAFKRFKLLSSDPIFFKLHFQLFAAQFERVGDVLQEEEPEDNVLHNAEPRFRLIMELTVSTCHLCPYSFLSALRLNR